MESKNLNLSKIGKPAFVAVQGPRFNCTLTWLDSVTKLTLRLLMSYIYIYIYGAPSKARNANVVYIWTYVWQR